MSLSLIGQSDEHGWVRATGVDGETHKEVVLLKLGAVHIYVHEEYGRQPTRRIVYSSDARLTLHVPSPRSSAASKGAATGWSTATRRSSRWWARASW